MHHRSTATADLSDNQGHGSPLREESQLEMIFVRLRAAWSPGRKSQNIITLQGFAHLPTMYVMLHKPSFMQDNEQDKSIWYNKLLSFEAYCCYYYHQPYNIWPSLDYDLLQYYTCILIIMTILQSSEVHIDAEQILKRCRELQTKGYIHITYMNTLFFGL